MTNKIIEAATACGVWVPMGNDKQKDVAALARFYAIAYRAGLEDAAKVADAKHSIRSRDGFPREASTARALAAEIRALKETP